MLKYTKVELELLNDYNKYLFVEQGIRGAIVTCVKRNVIANNPAALTEDYDSTALTEDYDSTKLPRFFIRKRALPCADQCRKAILNG